ncbi:enoyl-CoA hydratase-related protein, partial [Alphaproteobacteria bacterium]|nr:enoyl-CoA hydratase-related protein [Alphaproteobacteria bacterium]
MSDILEKEVSESGVLTLRMNRPDVLNSLNSDIVFALIDAFNNAAEDDNVRAIVLTGNGRGFCAGADLAGGNWPSEKGMTPGDITANSMEIGFNPLVRAVVDSPKPVITAINGVAAGGGVGLALSGDLVLAAESAKFRLVFAPQLGIIPDVGASWLVPNLVGRARANGLALLGDDLSAEKAQEWGMVWEVHPDDQLVAKAQEYA